MPEVSTARVAMRAFGAAGLAFVLVFVLVGILWDPNGVNLFERSVLDASRIVVLGFLYYVPVVVGGRFFQPDDPVGLAIGCSLLGALVLGVVLRSSRVGRVLTYTSVFLWFALGTYGFCLMA